MGHASEFMTASETAMDRDPRTRSRVAAPASGTLLDAGKAGKNEAAA